MGSAGWAGGEVLRGVEDLLEGGQQVGGDVGTVLHLSAATGQTAPKPRRVEQGGVEAVDVRCVTNGRTRPLQLARSSVVARRQLCRVTHAIRTQASRQ